MTADTSLSGAGVLHYRQPLVIVPSEPADAGYTTRLRTAPPTMFVFSMDYAPFPGFSPTIMTRWLKDVYSDYSSSLPTASVAGLLIPFVIFGTLGGHVTVVPHCDAPDAGGRSGRFHRLLDISLFSIHTTTPFGQWWRCSTTAPTWVVVLLG